MRTEGRHQKTKGTRANSKRLKNLKPKGPKAQGTQSQGAQSPRGPKPKGQKAMVHPGPQKLGLQMAQKCRLNTSSLCGQILIAQRTIGW